mmetsp:Transcript_3576/g.13808  ORF Transcript_3576/g.13808 Transcript_3576/m.13808 type:complete len:226 (+) Transcript_3576:654-1331(+)
MSQTSSRTSSSGRRTPMAATMRTKASKSMASSLMSPPNFSKSSRSWIADTSCGDRPTSLPIAERTRRISAMYLNRKEPPAAAPRTPSRELDPPLMSGAAALPACTTLSFGTRCDHLSKFLAALPLTTHRSKPPRAQRQFSTLAKCTAILVAHAFHSSSSSQSSAGGLAFAHSGSIHEMARSASLKSAFVRRTPSLKSATCTASWPAVTTPVKPLIALSGSSLSRV